MKLKVINFDSKNVFGSIKQAVFTSALSYGKMYELLHKQIWRKAPYRISTYGNHTYNNRPVTYIRSWKLNSAATVPYSYEGGDNTFGLNQLFVGQDYRKEYVGDPKDGIYHDTCSIFPKTIKTNTSTYGYKSAWVYYYQDVNDEAPTYNFNYCFVREDNEGNILIDDVVLVSYSVTQDSITTYYKKIVITNHDSTITEIELGSYDSNSSFQDGIYYASTQSFGGSAGDFNWYRFGEDMSAHGGIISEEPILSPITSWSFNDPGWIRTYEDGTVVEFTPLGAGDSETGSYYYPTYRILPMMYTDTGDLTMDRVEFIDKWDDYFELIVAEDSEWWSGLIKPISIIVAAVIIYFSWGTLSPISKAIVVVGYLVYAVGVLSNNTNMMLIGGILMAGVSLYTAFESFTTTSAVTSAQLSTMGTGQALTGTAFSETFTGYASAAGMENLLVMPTVESYTSLTLEGLVTTTAPYASFASSAGMSVADYVSLTGANAFSIDSLMSIGKELYSAYNQTNQLLNKNSSTSSETISKEDNGIRLSISNDENEDDVMEYIKKVIAI